MADEIDRLEDKLAEQRAEARARVPALFPLIERAAAELEETVVKKAVAIGERAPDFELPITGSEKTVRLSDSLNRGPVVLSFYRGHW